MKKLFGMMLLLLCAASIRAELKQVNGVYQIGTAEDLAAFGALLPSTPQIDAVLTADITYTGAPLGGDKPFWGVFDGAGHTITLNQTRTSNGGGLFWSAEDCSVIKNLVVNGTINTSSTKCGTIAYWGSALFYNCVADVTINSTYAGADASHAGFIARADKRTRIVNCVSATKVNFNNAAFNFGGFVGWIDANAVCTMKNCICVAEVLNEKSGGSSNTIARHGSNATPTMQNCYYLTKLTNVDGSIQQKTETEFKDGTVLTLLNNSSIVQWKQGEDYPMPIMDNQPYEISTKEDFIAFATHVNNGNFAFSAKMTKNIDMEEDQNMKPIGNDTWPYRGTFDGQGHTISNLHIDCASPAGLFGTIAANACITNLVLDASCSVKSTGYAGIIGHSTGGKKIWLTGLGNLGTVTSTGSGVGGIIGNCNAGSVLVADKCWSAGDISGAGDAAAICGWTNAAGSSITNCWSISDIKNGKQDDAHYFFRFGTAPTTSGNYCTNGTQTPNILKADVLSGKFCYEKLNTPGQEPTWFQNLGGENSLPTLFNDEKVNYVGDAGYATFFDAEKAWELQGDATANIVTIEGTTANLTTIDDIPAGTAVVLSGTYYNKVACATPTATTTGNVLKGAATDLTAEQMAAANPDCTKFYALSLNKENELNSLGFYYDNEDGSAFAIEAGKGYLALPVPAGSQAISGFRFGNGEDATGIESLKLQTFDGVIYNLQGQRVNANAKGIVIMNGKKVLVK